MLGASQEFANKKVTRIADNAALYVFSELERKDNVALYFVGIGKKKRMSLYIFSEVCNSEEKILGINNLYPDDRRRKHVTSVENVISSVTYFLEIRKSETCRHRELLF